MTPREVAINLIKSYVLRGETIEQLARGMLGVCCTEYAAQIGGYMWKREDLQKPGATCFRKLKPYEIGVERVAGVEVMAVFSLQELYNEIKRGSEQLTLL